MRAKCLSAHSKNIFETQDTKKQRKSFNTLSKNIYELIKDSKLSEDLYYQYCLQDANWLNK